MKQSAQKGFIQTPVIIVAVIALILGLFVLSQRKLQQPVVKPSSELMTAEQATTAVQILPEVQKYLQEVPNGKVEMDNELEGEYNVHVYEVKNGHTATFNWYTVNKKTGKLEGQLDLSKNEETSTATSTAKGVIIVESPAKGEEIKSPLTVIGLVYGNNGTLTIKLKQKEGGQYVTEDKVVKISGKSDNISFAESLQFGLPATPQTGILEIEYKDASGGKLNDKVTMEVEFPSDLGKGI